MPESAGSHDPAPRHQPGRSVGATRRIPRGRQGCEEAGAIWLAASLWDFLHPVYEEWRGQPARLTREAYRGVVGFLRERDIAEWHHRMTHALPETILYWELAEMVRPRGPRHVVALACLNVRLVRAEWSLVRVVGSTQRLRSVE